MKKLYTCNLGYKNEKIEEFLLEKIRNDEEVIYILPTVDAIEKYKKYYIEKLGGFFNLTFHTFDSIKKSVTMQNTVDEPFSLYIVSNILENNNYKYLRPISDGLVEKTMNFIKRAKEEMLDTKALLNSTSPLLREIADVLVKYDLFLKKYKLCDGLECDLNFKRLDFKNVIIDGFYTFRKIDLLILKELSKKSNILVNMAFYFDDLKILKDTEEEILSLGFEKISLNNKCSVEKEIERNREKLNFIIEENEDLESRAIYQELKRENILNNVDFSKMAIVLASNNKYILNNRNREKIDLNIKSLEVKHSPILAEFKSILDFSLEKSRENLLRRLNSNYFKVTEYQEEMEYEILKMDFNSLDELVENSKEKIEISENNLEEFLDLLKKLKKKPMKKAGFKYYSNYYREYLDIASEYIEDIYEIFKNDFYLKRDMNIISSIDAILDILERYDIFFGEVDLKTYLNILNVYIDNISIESKNYYASSYVSLIETLYLDYETVFLAGLNEKYPSYKEGNFIFSKENKEILKNLGMKSEDDLYIYENELVKIFSLIENSKKVFLTASSKDIHSVLLDLFLGNDFKILEKKDATNFSDLFFEILKDIKKDKIDFNKIANLNYNGEIRNLNKRIYGEKNRNNNVYDGIISNNALYEVKNILNNRYYSATDFDLYAESPFRFLFERLLKVEPMKREFDDEYYLKLGTNYHNILEEYFRNFPFEYNEKYLEELTYSVFFEGKVTTDIDNILQSLEYNYHLNLLKDFVKNDINTRKGEKPIAFEEEFKYKLSDITLVGRIDRVDLLGENEVLIDYKSGGAPSRNDILNGKSFQFPIYALAREKNVVEAKYGKIKESKYTTVIKNKEILGGSGKYDFTNDTFDDFLLLTKQRILSMQMNMFLGKFNFLESKYNNISDLCRGDSIE